MVSGLKAIAYFAQWAIYARKHFVQDVPADQLTHILYSFADIKANTGEVFLTDTYADTDQRFPTDSWNENGTNVYGNIKQLYLLKKKNRKLKTLLSIGGWTYSAHFPTALSTPEGRSTFASTAVTLLKDLGFDGLDVDWEYPDNAAQAMDFVLLLKECRRQLDLYYAEAFSSDSKITDLDDESNNNVTVIMEEGTASRPLLTIAAPCGAQHYSKLLIAEMDAYLDFWNLMAYDFSGAWDSTSGHQSNLYKSTTNPTSTPFSTADAVDYYISHGVTPSKIILGMPLYGRSFVDTDGPGTKYATTGAGSWENGIWDYSVLPQSNAELFYDEESGATWSYDNRTRTMMSFDTAEMQKVKAGYVLEKGLGGAMWWESSSDKKIGSGASLIETVVNEFGGPKSKMLDDSLNTLSYPKSKYDNIRNMMYSE
ncbi:glycoside hydrolase superfamily [Peziza echinospora]|nr:glycoside hydrolase superfamily [Peziza echinospora]